MELNKTHRYPGVKPFSANERHVFYGRSTDTRKLSQLIRLEKLVLLYSKSGLGKSSLLHAGVLPLFDEDKQYTTVQFRFGARFDNSQSPVVTCLFKLPDTLSNPVLDKIGAGNDTLWLRMKGVQQNTDNPAKTYILVFDQFEELFTYDEDDIKQFKKQLADLLYSKVPPYISKSITNRLKENPEFLTNEEIEYLYRQLNVKVVLSIRSDRLSLLNTLTDYFPDILKNYYELKPLDHEAATDAIVKPAADKRNIYLSPPFDYTGECINKILNYLNENGQKSIETFQLQTICQFAENIVIENRLSTDTDKKQPPAIEPEMLGDLQNIFRTHYDKLIKNIELADKQQAARLLIENKLIIDGNRVSLPDVIVLKEKGVDKQLVTYLHDTHHLLRSEPNTTGGISYELSHDTLVTPILKAKKEREDKEELDRQENEKIAELLREREEAEKEKTERKKERKRQRNITIIIAIAAVLAIILSISSILMWQRAERETQKAQSLTIAAFGPEQLDKNPTIAIRLAELAWKTFPTYPPLPPIQRIISEAFYGSNESQKVYYKCDLSGHTGIVYSAVFSPDGKQIVTASADNAAKIWDAVTGKKTTNLSGHTGVVYSAVFSPDGKQIVTASADNTAKIWDAATGKETATLSGHAGIVYRAAFSPSGKQIVTASADNTAKIWDAVTGKKTTNLSGHTGPIYNATFSPNGEQIVTASYDNTAKIWDAATGKKTADLSGHTSAVISATFSPDGKQIVTASDDSTAKIWDAATGKKTTNLSGHTGPIYNAVFSPDGKQIVTASADSTAKIWDAVTGKKTANLSGHTGPIYNATFSPNGEQIVTASYDNTAKIWDAATGKKIADLSGHTSAVIRATFSPNGKQIVTASADNIAKIWDAATGKEIAALSGHKGSIYNAVFSPSGKQIITASKDSTAKIWLTPAGIIEWLSKQHIYILTYKDLETLSIDFVDLEKTNQ